MQKTPTLHNTLRTATSPYLLQHADNPVHWQQWSQETLELARIHDKPMLVSIGYAACHWCHVMAHESFENPDIADAMNAMFINIKIDREEMPDVDHEFMHLLHVMGVQGGWPLTMFLRPNGDPVYGGTYFPPRPMRGMPGFLTVMEQVCAFLQSDDCDDLVARLQAALVQGEATHKTLTPIEIIAMAQQIRGHFDDRFGGLQGAPKFPQTPVLKFLWLSGICMNDDDLCTVVCHTLDNICKGGIYDHLAGGFARYATDERWLIPHFEKMLYDNATLLEILVYAYAKTDNVVFSYTIHQTIAWLSREMQMPGGGFACALDADQEGEEGKFYTWQKSGIVKILGDAAEGFCQAYGVSEGGNWEGVNILNRQEGVNVSDAVLAGARDELLQARATRTAPGRDDKILAHWNGIMIDALVLAAMQFSRSDWLAMAVKAYDFVTTHMI
ncbi:MAG: thioredoxin domain-containing protein, partial [Pseudomonadota bacterium]